jgi:hypothetical protein
MNPITHPIKFCLYLILFLVFPPFLRASIWFVKFCITNIMTMNNDEKMDILRGLPIVAILVVISLELMAPYYLGMHIDLEIPSFASLLAAR